MFFRFHFASNKLPSVKSIFIKHVYLMQYDSCKYTHYWHPNILYVFIFHPYNIILSLFPLSHDLQVPPPQGSMMMHMRPPTTGPFPTPIQRPVMQVNKPVIIRSPPYQNPGREPSRSTPPSAPEPPVKGPEDGMKVSHPL